VGDVTCVVTRSWVLRAGAGARTPVLATIPNFQILGARVVACLRNLKWGVERGDAPHRLRLCVSSPHPSVRRGLKKKYKDECEITSETK
jgi:hypothetical protein